jgi:6-pyruvoyl-tetrahydropterin synthase
MPHVTISFGFEAAHRVLDRNGRGDPHGHSFVVELVVSADTAPDGISAEFGDVKRIANELIVTPWNNAFLVDVEDKELRAVLGGHGWRIGVLVGPTTDEGIAKNVAMLLRSPLTAIGATLRSVTVRDTPTTSATWSA